MASLTVTELSGGAPERLPVAKAPAITRYDLTIGAEANRTFQQSTNPVRLKAGADCRYIVDYTASTAKTATTTVSDPLSSGETEYIWVEAGGVMQISVISPTGS